MIANCRFDGEWLEPESLRAATAIQREIAELAEAVDRLGPVRLIAGADVSMRWRDTRGPIHAAIALLNWPDKRLLASASLTVTPRFPYVPGYLGFREAPALIAAWGRLEEKPDLLLMDGQGRAHPRRCGVATQLGVLLDVPTIGVAKSLLCGAVEGGPGERPGDRAPVVDRGEVVAMAVRTRAGARPIYVSTGHRISIETAVEWVLALCGGRRQPLPIRLAHDAANAARRAASEAQA